MRNDFSIACNSPRYKFGVVWASVGILIYPVGVLLLYAYCLWQNKDDIMAFKAAEILAREDKEEETLRQNLLDLELNETQDSEKTIALKKRLAVAVQRRTSRINGDNVTPRSASPAVARIVTAAELTFLFKAYEGKVTDKIAMQYRNSFLTVSSSSLLL